jgi:TRAP-type C4-dicarboxylate transport system permease small subunit
MILEKVISKIVLIYDMISNFLAYFSGVLFAFITVSVCAEVIIRRFWISSIVGVIECSEHALVFITFLSASWVLKQDAHVKVDVLLGWQKPRNQALLNMITSSFGAVLCMFIAYRSALTVWDLWQRNIDTVKALELPMAPLYTPIFIGSLMLSLQFLRRARSSLVEKKAAASTE